MREPLRAVRVPDLRKRKERGEKIAVLTAYDATMAGLFDRAGIDVLLVGDSLGTVILGYDSTVPVTLDDMLHHTAAVSRGSKRALVVADMPFLSYQVSVPEALRNASRLIQKGAAAAVKMEGAGPVVGVTRALSEVGIPVMGHLGLTPQAVHALGGYRSQARDQVSASQLIEDAHALEEAGASGLFLEAIPDEVAGQVTTLLSIPTIGIGAGPYCDGQVLVSYDVFGIFDKFTPSFVRRYASLGDTLVSATRSYIDDVRNGHFPEPRGSSPAGATPKRMDLVEKES